MIDHEEALKLIDKAYSDTSDLREMCANDNYFATVSQWDDDVCEFSTTEYRGQFDTLTRSIRTVKGEMLQRPVEVKFRPKTDSPQSKSASDFIQKMYRASSRNNSAREAVDVAIDGQLITGIGAWRICTEYEDEQSLESFEQKITRKPIHEAYNTVLFDPAATRKDKSDASWVCVLTSFTEDSYKAFLKSIGEDENRTQNSVKNPRKGMVWSSPKKIFIAEFYERETTKKKICIVQKDDDRVVVEKTNTDMMAMYAEAGYDVVATKTINEKKIIKHLFDGQGKIGKSETIAGKHLPIVPVYGEWRIVDGVEMAEGVVRRAKDPQRLHNMTGSFIADQVGKSPAEKPFFYPEQVAGYESLFQPDSEMSFYLLNRKAADGTDLPSTPLGYLKKPEMSQTEAALMEITRSAVQEVTTTPMVQDQALSGQVTEGQLRVANAANQAQTMIYQSNLEAALRRDAEIWLSMATDIYTESRPVLLMNDDNSTDYARINEPAYGADGLPTINNQISDAFDVYTDIGRRYDDARTEAIDKLSGVVQQVGIQDKLGRFAYLESLALMAKDIPGADSFREAIDRERLFAGLRKPQTPEEQQMLQQPQQPDPMQVMAQAEAQKAEAKTVEAKTKAQVAEFQAAKAAADAQLANAKTTEILEKLKPDDLEELERMLRILKSTETPAQGGDNPTMQETAAHENASRREYQHY